MGLSPCLRQGHKRECCLVSKEKEVLESKDLRHQGGCEHSLGRPRNAQSGTGLPVALEWNAHYSYSDIKGGDPRRLENNPVRNGTVLAQRNRACEREAAPGPAAHSSRARITPGPGGCSTQSSHHQARAHQPAVLSLSSCWGPQLPFPLCPVSSKTPVGAFASQDRTAAPEQPSSPL